MRKCYLLIFIFVVVQFLFFQNSFAQKDDPKGAWEFERMRTADPATGEVPHEKFEQARKMAKQQLLEQRAAGMRDYGNWTERGPNNFGGRTRAIMWDPNDITHKKVWAGGVNGGLWVNEDITDENSSWTLAFSDVNGFAISSITYDPGKDTIFYLGTGEYWAPERNQARGGSVWKSENGGLTWNKIDQELHNNINNIKYINKLVVDNDGVLFVGTNRGLVSYNGTSWNTSLIINGNISDIEITDNNTKYVAGSSAYNVFFIYRCLPGNTSFTPVTPENLDLAFRVELTVYDNDPDTVYAIGIESSDDGGDVAWFIKTTNGFSTWSNINIPNYIGWIYCIPNLNKHFTDGQGWYDITLQVAENNHETLVVGGIDLYRSTNGGSNWDRISARDGNCKPNVHADQHNILINPNNTDEVIISNDGGVWYSTNLFNTSVDPSFSVRNKNYSVTQFYTCYYSSSSDMVIGGTQDNGTIQISNANSQQGNEVTGGDGGYCFIDNSNNNIQISSYKYASYSRTTDNWLSETNIYRKSFGNAGFFINPTCYDKKFKILYASHDEQKLLRIKGITSNPDADVLTLNLINDDEKITSIYMSNDVNHRIIFGTKGAVFESRKIYIADNANNEPNIISITGDLNIANYNTINSITQGENSNTIFITIFDNHNWSSSVFLTIDGGEKWVPKSGIGLPNIPVNWAEFNPNDFNQVIIATDIGLYITNDITQDEPNWEIIDLASGQDSSLILVSCRNIRVRPSDSKVYVATHGRGIWESDIFMDNTSVPNLVISNVNPIVSSAELNETITVSVTISNIGNLNAAYNTSKCYISDDDILDDNDIFLFQYSMGAIASGQNLITNNWNLTIPGSIGAGNKYLIYQTDALDNVNEGSHENDNILGVPITIYPASSGGSGPDLTVLNEFVSKRVIEQGQSFSVNCDILNQGDQDASGDWRQKWYLSSNQTYSEDDLQLDFLQWAFLWSDSSNYIHRVMTMPNNISDGEYYILIYIDSNEELIETVESNNIKALPITVGTIPVPILYSPMDDEEEVSFTPTFYWENLGADVDTYEFAIYDYVTQNGNTYLQQVYYKSGLSESEWQVTNFNFDYNEGYKWTARSRLDGTHGGWATLFSFQTKHYLSKPVLYDPNNYITNELLAPTFTWSNVNNANYYKLTIALDEEMDDEVEDWSGITENWFTIPTGLLDTAITYYWNIKAYSGAGNSDYSQVFQFRTGGDIAPGQPVNIIPVHDSTEVSLTPQLVWNTGNGVSLSYQVDIASDTIFDTIVFTQNNITLTNYFVPDGYLDGLTKYYWRVRGWNGAGYGCYSDSSAFTTTTTGGPGTIKWFIEIGLIRGTPVFDLKGYMWCVIEETDAVVKLNPLNGDTLFTLPNYARPEFNEGLTLSHDGNTVYTIADNDIFGSEDSYFVTALDLDGNVLWYYDTYCRGVSKPALDALVIMYFYGPLPII